MVESAIADKSKNMYTKLLKVAEQRGYEKNVVKTTRSA